jgi:hypothetical protein
MLHDESAPAVLAAGAGFSVLLVFSANRKP